ncbi:YbjC family protein [Erwiniaceae bacterium CAU 1747]
MRALTQLPRPILILEALGGVILILALLTLHEMLPLPPPFTGKLAATIMIFAGIVLMLPAAVVMMWRTAKAMAPDLFNTRHSPDKKKGNTHDADH